MARKKVSKPSRAEQVAHEQELDVDHETVPAPPPKHPNLKKFEKLVKGLEDWRPARDVLSSVRAVPTIFPAFDRATRVGGYPLDRFCVVHGPTANGKTVFCQGLGKSFLEAGHMFAFVDAEYTTPHSWCEELLGVELANSPAFVALRPKTYEETVDSVRSLVKKLAKARDEGELPEGTSCLVVVDSLRKLVPQNIWEKLKKSSEEVGIDGMGGRAGQIKAAMNAAWLDELTPLLYHTGTGLLAIEREREDRDNRGKTIAKMGGGQSVEFESSMTVRVTRTYVYEGSGEDASVVGEKHELMIRKSKVAGLDEKVSWGYFHTSNGAVSRAGFDRARDVVELAREFGMVETSGAWLSWKGEGKRWQGVNNAVAKLSADPEMLAKLEAQTRAGFAADKPAA